MTHEEHTIQAITKALPAVVSILIGKDEATVEKDIPKEIWDEIAKETKSEPDPPTHEEIIGHMPHVGAGKIQVGNGSGFIVSADGHILTNKHVVTDAAADYTIITTANDRYTAKVLARDPLNDVAILKIEADNLPTVELGDSNSARLGQSVIALGNALGEFANSASAGIISGLARFLSAISDDAKHSETLRGLIQTDAAINPGNSGGPLINLDGEVIGINAAVVSGAENIGFAIPINRAKKDLEDVREFGRVRWPFLGVRYMPIDAGTKKHFKLPIDHGLLIKGEKIPDYPAVLTQSPADKAGIRENDILLEINGEAISAEHSLEDALEKSEIGQTLKLKILRAGVEQEIQVTLEERK
ncbi:MAG: hypothetical protein A3H71_00235 [Candidatus Sungbacteria bacterium RIFCSPLOWO2_02_FULL_48_13b]|uniref:PDZ domain-containing protein n=2 Tax=Candidatus Sungiibacteriota TaxID=1817917 RepID=A0A1G2LII0_9BACT|nr:MAG: hypothetical protein A3C12_01000 [Candidatus Sungbacteria bacterium RIFCSPHIGHO2_02_FULL_49_20]OHA11435.1 MAG: hypothetical protein A3H71_00235 [Candidatus Sungbacteria bacterium RIFCSPLOWO2_02_FULL_48_13b]